MYSGLSFASSNKLPYNAPIRYCQQLYSPKKMIKNYIVVHSCNKYEDLTTLSLMHNGINKTNQNRKETERKSLFAKVFSKIKNSYHANFNIFLKGYFVSPAKRSSRS